ncbi:MAG TPA: hypothetical protein VFY95_09195 [Sphingomicrobium sp.]
MPGDGMRGGFEPPQPPVPEGLDRFPLRKKLTFTIVVFCGLVFVVLAVPLTGITKPWKPVRDLYGLDMSLSKPTLSGTNPSGTFKLKYRLFGFDSDASGGACLIADIADLVPAGDAHKGEIYGGACTTQAQCNKAGTSQIWYGYCVPAGKNQPGRCWYKPADNDGAEKQLCQKSAYYPSSDPAYVHGTPWDVGVDHKVPNTDGFDLQAFYRDHTGGKPAQWRISGLLWGTQPNTLRGYYGDPACVPAGKC